VRFVDCLAGACLALVCFAPVRLVAAVRLLAAFLAGEALAAAALAGDRLAAVRFAVFLPACLPAGRPVAAVLRRVDVRVDLATAVSFIGAGVVEASLGTVGTVG